MTKFADPSFSVPMGGEKYAENWEGIFRGTSQEIPKTEMELFVDSLTKEEQKKLVQFTKCGIDCWGQEYTVKYLEEALSTIKRLDKAEELIELANGLRTD